MKKGSLVLLVVVLIAGIFAITAFAHTARGWSDNFNRADSPSLGNGWVEVENPSNPSTVEIDGYKVVFDSDDEYYKPSFSREILLNQSEGVYEGEVLLEYDWNFNRTGDENTYYMYAQLGQCSKMSDTSIHDGVAANLAWGNINSTHENFAAGWTSSGGYDSLTTADGDVEITLEVDIDNEEWSAQVYEQGENVVFKSGIAYDDPTVQYIDCVRFMMHRMYTGYFTGNWIDNVSIQANGHYLPTLAPPMSPVDTAPCWLVCDPNVGPYCWTECGD